MRRLESMDSQDEYSNLVRANSVSWFNYTVGKHSRIRCYCLGMHYLKDYFTFKWQRFYPVA